MSEQNKVGPVKKFFRATLGPITMVKQSVGSNLGGTLKDQYQLWRRSSYTPLANIIEKRHTYDLDRKCVENGKTEADVRSAYNHVRVVMTVLITLWAGCLVQLGFGSPGAASAFLMVLGSVSLTVAIMAAAHHQVCIREKTFLSPKESLMYFAAYPSNLLPISLPEDWKINRTEATSVGEGRAKRKIRVRPTKKKRDH